MLFRFGLLNVGFHKHVFTNCIFVIFRRNGESLLHILVKLVIIVGSLCHFFVSSFIVSPLHEALRFGSEGCFLILPRREVWVFLKFP